jgi:hypothetical protein
MTREGSRHKVTEPRRGEGPLLHDALKDQRRESASEATLNSTLKGGSADARQ